MQWKLLHHIECQHTMIRTYTELITFATLKERFDYLRLKAHVSDATFGSERWINQNFYRSYEWRNLRNSIIVRDEGGELGFRDYPIMGRIIIHHLNPIRPIDLVQNAAIVLDPDNLISVSHQMHNAIHYGDQSLIPKDYVPRRPGDTKEW